MFFTYHDVLDSGTHVAAAHELDLGPDGNFYHRVVRVFSRDDGHDSAHPPVGRLITCTFAKQLFESFGDGHMSQ